LLADRALPARQVIDPGLFVKLGDAVRVVLLRDPEARGLFGANWSHLDRDLRLRLLVMLQNVAIVHPIELVAGENDDVAMREVGDMGDGAPDGVGSALVPELGRRRLLGGEQGDEATAYPVEDVAARDVIVQARGVVLRKNEYAVQLRVDAVGDGHVYQPVFAGQRDGRVGTINGEREAPGAGSAAEDDRPRVVHVGGGGGSWAERALGQQATAEVRPEDVCRLARRP